MLATMATILKSSLEAGLLLVLFLIGLSKAGLNKQKTAVYVGLIGAAISAVVFVYGVDFFGDREVFEGYLAFAASVTAGGFGFWIWRQLPLTGAEDIVTIQKRPVLTTIIVTLASGIIILGKMVELVLFPSSLLLMSSNLLNTEVVLKIAGALLSLIVTAIFVFIFLRIEGRITRREFVLYSFAALLIVIFRQVITGLQVLFATGVLPLTTWAVTIIAPLINSYYPLFFYTLVGLTLVLWVLVGRRVNKAYPDTSAAPNAAQKRKLLAGFYTEKRWLRVLGFCLFTVVLILGGNIAFANKSVKIEPPTPVAAQGGRILIPLEQVNDGKLHRYAYLTPQGVETRFIVIKKGENLFGTGLDACDICGNAGYYQRGKELICKNCDVVINIPTVGFPGGCNPIPIKNKTDGSNVEISAADLEAKQEVFRE